jgi:hypothetical protein
MNDYDTDIKFEEWKLNYNQHPPGENYFKISKAKGGYINHGAASVAHQQVTSTKDWIEILESKEALITVHIRSYTPQMWQEVSNALKTLHVAAEQERSKDKFIALANMALEDSLLGRFTKVLKAANEIGARFYDFNYKTENMYRTAKIEILVALEDATLIRGMILGWINKYTQHLTQLNKISVATKNLSPITGIWNQAKDGYLIKIPGNGGPKK